MTRTAIDGDAFFVVPMIDAFYGVGLPGLSQTEETANRGFNLGCSYN